MVSWAVAKGVGDDWYRLREDLWGGAVWLGTWGGSRNV